jgi:hypothetical protein
MRKVYKINGKTEVHEVFTSPSGKTKYKVAFTKGNLDPKNRVPARFSTDSPIIQAVIENSPKFNRVIFLEKVYGNVAPAAAPVMNAASAAVPAPKKGKGKAAETKGSELKVMEDVKTIADAASVLTAEGVLAAEIDGTVEGAIKVAKKYGISFPNLKGEE